MTAWGFKGLGNRYLELPDSPLPLSPPGSARIAFSQGAGNLQGSINAGAYSPLGAGAPVTGALITPYTVRGSLYTIPTWTADEQVPCNVNPWGLTTGTVAVQRVYVVARKTVPQSAVDNVSITVRVQDYDENPNLQLCNTTDTDTLNFTVNTEVTIPLITTPTNLDLSLGYRAFRVETTQVGAGQIFWAEVFFDCTYTAP